MEMDDQGLGVIWCVEVGPNLALHLGHLGKDLGLKGYNLSLIHI